MRADRRDCLILALLSIIGALLIAIIGALFCTGCGAVVPMDEPDWPDWTPPDDAGGESETPETPDGPPDPGSDPGDTDDDAEEGPSPPDSAPEDADPPSDAIPDDSEAPDAPEEADEDGSTPCQWCGEGSAAWPSCIARYTIRIQAGHRYEVDGCGQWIYPGFSSGAECSAIWSEPCPGADGFIGYCNARSAGTIEVCVSEFPTAPGPRSWCVSVTGGPCEEG